MRRQGGVRAGHPSLRQRGVLQAAGPSGWVAGWLSGAARSVRQKFITIIFPPGFLLEQWGESGSCIRG